MDNLDTEIQGLRDKMAKISSVIGAFKVVGSVALLLNGYQYVEAGKPETARMKELLNEYFAKGNIDFDIIQEFKLDIYHQKLEALLEAGYQRVNHEGQVIEPKINVLTYETIEKGISMKNPESGIELDYIGNDVRKGRGDIKEHMLYERDGIIVAGLSDLEEYGDSYSEFDGKDPEKHRIKKEIYELLKAEQPSKPVENRFKKPRLHGLGFKRFAFDSNSGPGSSPLPPIRGRLFNNDPEDSFGGPKKLFGGARRKTTNRKNTFRKATKQNRMSSKRKRKTIFSKKSGKKVVGKRNRKKSTKRSKKK